MLFDSKNGGIGNIIPFPFVMEPLSQITPFSYRDGLTYAKMLEGLRAYLNSYIVPSFNEKMDELLNHFQDGIENAENTVITSKLEWQKFFDDFIANFQGEIKLLNDEAISQLIVDVDSATGATLRELFVSTARMEIIEALVTTGRLSETGINQKFDEFFASTVAPEVIRVADELAQSLRFDLATKDALALTNASVAAVTAESANNKTRIAELERIYPVAPIDAVFIGDSYFTGYQPLPTPWIKSVPEFVIEKLNKRGLNNYVNHNYAGNAGGYDSSIGGGDTTFQTQVNDAIAANHPNCRLIVFGGGRNDSNSGKDVNSKARAMYKQIRTKYPMAKIVVAPLWDNTRFRATQLATFTSIFNAAEQEGCVYNVNSLWISGLTPDSEWIDSIPHPKLAVAESMANGIVSLIDGGSLPGITHKFFVRDSSGASNGIASLNQFTVSVSMKNEIGGDFGADYVIGRLDPIFRPAGNQYIVGFSGSGSTLNLYQIVGETGDFGLQASAGGKTGLCGFVTSYPVGAV